MKKAICAIVISLTAMSSLGLLAETDTAAVTVKERDSQAVLYTVYRGDYAQIGAAIGKLFALAGPKGIRPAGNVYLVYLNNPKLVSKEHWLTEIRVPVGEDALKLAGSLGEMTDVKKLQAVTVAAIKKPTGVEDLSPVYKELFEWIAKNGYISIDGCMEEMKNQGPAANYSQTESVIMVPIEKMGNQ